MDSQKIMPLIFKDSVQPPGDPEDQARKQEGKCIRCKKAEGAAKAAAQKHREERAPKLHQKQGSKAKAHGQKAVGANPLPSQLF